MISRRLSQEINNQINKEYYSEYLYLGIMAWFKEQNLDGFANFFAVQMQEERFHMNRFLNYLLDMGVSIDLEPIAKPPINFASPKEAFEYSLAHERTVTASINNLMSIAVEDKDFASQSFLNWFIDEQVEEEATFGKIVAKLNLIKDNSSGLFMLDNELSTRTFTPPTNA